jgi:hypothetical protein
MKDISLNFSIYNEYNIAFNLGRVIFVNDYDFHSIIRVAIRDFLK